MGYCTIRLVGRIHHALSDRAALADCFVVVMEIDAAIHIVLGTERGQSLRAHVAEVTVATDKIRTPRCLG